MASIRIDGWRSSIRFDAAHFIPGHPKCGRLHGHTYALHAVVHGRPGPGGMILDFGDVKRVLKDIADQLDHHVLVQTKSPDFSPREADGRVEFTVRGKSYTLPREDVEFVDLEYTTAEALAEWVADQVLARVDFPEEVERVEVGLDESYGKGAWAERTL